jgi:uncharacterized protein YggE
MLRRIILGVLVSFLITFAENASNLLVVYGKGTIDDLPDLAVININYSLQDSNPEKLYERTEKIISEFTEFLKKQGIKEEMKTENRRLFPQYDYQTSPPQFINYQMDYNLKIKTKNLKKISAIIKELTRFEGTLISGINIDYTYSNLEKLLGAASKKALNDAITKAQTLAREAKLKLGEIVRIEETLPPPGWGCEANSSLGFPLEVNLKVSFEIQNL